MIRRLRRQHILIWTMMAFLLPAGIIIAWIAVPQKIAQPLLQPSVFTPLPVVLKKAEAKDYSVFLRTGRDTSQLQLEWINKTVLQFPTATIYAYTDDVKNIHKMRLIGRIEARGIWHFALDSTFKQKDANRFLLYDFIHDQIIDTINLLP